MIRSIMAIASQSTVRLSYIATLGMDLIMEVNFHVPWPSGSLANQIPMCLQEVMGFHAITGMVFIVGIEHDNSYTCFVSSTNKTSFLSYKKYLKI